MTDLSGFEGRTPRMRLRPYALSDLAEFSDLHGRDDVARYLPWETRDAQASRTALERHQLMTLARDGDAVSLAGFDLDSGRLVGEFVLILRDEAHRGAELGYVVHPDFQGRGLAVEGSLAVLQVAFDELGLHRVVARIDARNEPSAGVLRRLGMRREGLLVKNVWSKGEWTDQAVYAILEEEWRGHGTRSLIASNAIAPASTSAAPSESSPA